MRNIDSIPNRLVIGALDSALNRIDSERRDHPKADDLQHERDCIQAARNFIADKRKVF